MMSDRLSDYISLLTLDPEDVVNYTFVKTLQNQLQALDFMREYEDALSEKMLKRFNDHAKGFRPEQLVFPIETYASDEIDTEAFQALISREVVPPFIVKGFLKASEAVKNWRFDFFKDQYPEQRVAYGMRYPDGSIEDGLFGEMAEIIKKMTSDEPSTFYINNTAQIFKDHPDLLSSLGYEKLKSLYHPMAINLILQLFVGGENTGAELHCANEFNSFLMVNGKKRWTFVAPEYSYALRSTMSVNALNAVAEIPDHRKPFSELEKDFPLYNRVPKLVGEIEAGDMLVFSPWWWHAIQNTSPRSIAVATRWTAMKRDCFPRGNIAYHNIQKSNPLYQAYSKQFMNAVMKGELLGDVDVSRETFGKGER
jgi:hypothetical protein